MAGRNENSAEHFRKVEFFPKIEFGAVDYLGSNRHFITHKTRTAVIKTFAKAIGNI